MSNADAKLMKDKNGFQVSYNAQTAVDSETHLIRDYHMINQVTDHGLLCLTMEGIKSEDEEKIIEGIDDSPFLPHRAVHGLQVAFINHRDDCA